MSKPGNKDFIVDSRFRMWIKDRLHPLLMFLTRVKVKYKIELVNDYQCSNRKPIIFAANHSAFPDTPIILKSVRERAYILAGKQNLAPVDRLFFLLNGVIWVDRKSRVETAAAKDRLLAYLQKERSVMWCPEGTWNLTSNLLMLPMKWGIIEVARQANAEILPIALAYDTERGICRVKFGIPLSESDLQDKRKGIQTLRDRIATLRWDLMAQQPAVSRQENSPEKLRREVEQTIADYPPLDWEYEQSVIYWPPDQTTPEQVFEHLAHIVPRKETAFLFGKSKI